MRRFNSPDTSISNSLVGWRRRTAVLGLAAGTVLAASGCEGIKPDPDSPGGRALAASESAATSASASRTTPPVATTSPNTSPRTSTAPSTPTVTHTETSSSSAPAPSTVTETTTVPAPVPAPAPAPETVTGGTQRDLWLTPSCGGAACWVEVYEYPDTSGQVIGTVGNAVLALCQAPSTSGEPLIVIELPGDLSVTGNDMRGFSLAVNLPGSDQLTSCD